MAANDLINVYDPTFWAQETLAQLFPQLKMAGLVYRDFEHIVAERGDTINTRMPNRFTAKDADPDVFFSNKPKADNVQIKLDKWKELVFEIGDKEASLSMKDLTAEFMQPAAFAIAEAVEDAVLALGNDLPYTVGAAGVTPATVAALGTDIKEKFDTMQIPDGDRQVVLGPAAVNKFNQVFYQDYVSGSADQQTEGTLRRKFGLNYTDSNKLGSHTNGTATVGGTPQFNAGVAANVEPLGGVPLTSTVALKLLGVAAGTILPGDVFTVAHASGVASYTVVTGGVAAGGILAGIVISPGLRAAVLTSDPIVFVASHAFNLAFHKQAFALVTRPLKVPSAPGASVAVANFNGIGLRAATWYEPKDLRSYVRLDLLYGVKTLDIRKAFRVLG